MYLSVRARTVLRDAIRNYGHRGQVVSAQDSMHDTFPSRHNYHRDSGSARSKGALKEEEEII
jgi:hypothetical protein